MTVGAIVDTFSVAGCVIVAPPISTCGSTDATLAEAGYGVITRDPASTVGFCVDVAA